MSILLIAQSKSHQIMLSSLVEVGKELIILTPFDDAKQKVWKPILDDIPENIFSKIKIVRSWAKNKFFYSITTIFQVLLNKNLRNCDLIITESATENAFAASILKILLKKPFLIKLGIYVEQYHNLNSSKKSFIRKNLELLIIHFLLKFVFRIADAVICDNELLGKYVKKHYSKAKIEISLPYGIDVNRFFPVKNKKEKQFLRKNFGIIGKKIFLFVGRFNYEKGGVLPLIKAFKKLNNPLTTLILVGTGELKREYEKLIKALYVNNIRIIDKLPHKQVADIMKSCDYYVQPSLAEGHGIAPLEAMASGLLVLSTQVGGLKLTVKNGVTGIAIQNEKKEEDYFKAMGKAILMSEKDKQRILKNARQMVVDKYENEKMMTNFKKIIKKYIP